MSVGDAGRRVVVTGAASGIGAATVVALSRDGWDVVGVDCACDPSGSASTAWVRADLSTAAGVAAVREVLPGAAGLVNCAGVAGTQDPDLVVAVNLVAVCELTDAAVVDLADGGAVVNVASAAGAGWRDRLRLVRRLLDQGGREEVAAFAAGLGFDGPEAYSFSKEVVIVHSMMSSQTAVSRGVRVNSVSPGAVQTPLLPQFYESIGADVLDAYAAVTAGRNGLPDEVAEVISFLLSPRASWVNGVDLLVDGGGEAAVVAGTIVWPDGP